jgi:hypothetical protein
MNTPSPQKQSDGQDIRPICGIDYSLEEAFAHLRAIASGSEIGMQSIDVIDRALADYRLAKPPEQSAGTEPENLTQCLSRNIKAGIIDFAIRAQIKDGGVKFYIHPAAQAGDTLDFITWDDPENPDVDMLLNWEQFKSFDTEGMRERFRQMIANMKLSKP